MIKIVEIEKQDIPQKRYNVPTVAKAIGKSEGAINGYFSNRGISTKNGITVEQIAEVCRAKTRGASIAWADVKEIRKMLMERCGIQIVEDNS